MEYSTVFAQASGRFEHQNAVPVRSTLVDQIADVGLVAEVQSPATVADTTDRFDAQEIAIAFATEDHATVVPTLVFAIFASIVQARFVQQGRISFPVDGAL